MNVVKKAKTVEAKKELEVTIVKIDILIRSSKEDETILKEIHDAMAGAVNFIPNGAIGVPLLETSPLKVLEKIKYKKRKSKDKIPLSPEGKEYFDNHKEWLSDITKDFLSRGATVVKRVRWKTRKKNKLREMYKLTKAMACTHEGRNHLFELAKEFDTTPQNIFNVNLKFHHRMFIDSIKGKRKK